MYCSRLSLNSSTVPTSSSAWSTWRLNRIWYHIFHMRSHLDETFPIILMSASWSIPMGLGIANAIA